MYVNRKLSVLYLSLNMKISCTVIEFSTIKNSLGHFVVLLITLIRR